MDQICRGLQSKLKKNGGQVSTFADLGKQDGMKLSRAAFSVMVKHAGLTIVFEEMQQKLEQGGKKNIKDGEIAEIISSV